MVVDVKGFNSLSNFQARFFINIVDTIPKERINSYITLVLFNREY